ncbi:MAG: hypothetical protein OHK0011_01020 [Turneriella sp.]
MTPYAFISSKFGGIQRGKNFRADCPQCGKKQTLSWSTDHPHPFKCFACDYAGNVFTLGYRDETHQPGTTEERPQDPALDPLTIDGFKARRRKKGGSFAKNPHRLSERVVVEFGLRVRQVTGKQGRSEFIIPFNNAEGQMVKYLSTWSKGWFSPESRHKPKDFWLNLHRLGRNKNPRVIYVLAGEWDLFAFWEHTGWHGISPANGEMSRPPVEETDIFAGKTVIFLYDNDASGRKGSKQVASFILRHQKGVKIKVVNLVNLGCPAGEDIDWYFANGGTKDRLNDLIKNTPYYTDTTPEDLFKLINNLPERGIPRPENRVSELPAETLEVIWRAGALPENQKTRVFEQLALEEGIRPDQTHKIQQRLRYYENELSTLLYYAFDEYLVRAFREHHIKAQAVGSGLYLRNYYHYQNGVYRALTPEHRRRLVDNIARLICPPTNRMLLSRVRKQLDEDLTNRLDNLPDHEFDENLDIINFRNGLYSLKEGLLKAHTPAHLSTFQLGLNYEQGATCPWFQQALETWFEDDSIRKEFLKVCYYAITGNRGQHIAVFFYGEGGDGKGEAVKILKALVGDDRTSAISLEDLDDQFMPAGLFGKWLNIADEVNRKTHLNDGMFKRVTGESTMTANVKYGQPITFVPKALWVVVTNSIFSSSDNSRGFNRRLKFIVFRQVPEDRKIDGFFRTKLLPELPGIAEYILTEGKRLYETEGFKETKAEQNIKDDLTRGHSVNAFWQDMIADFAEGTSEVQLSRPVTNGEYDGWHYIDPHAFFERYTKHCQENGTKPSSYQNFARDSRNIIERLLNNPEVAPGKKKPVQVRPKRIRVQTNLYSDKKPMRVLLISADPKDLVTPEKASTTEIAPSPGVNFAKIWAETPPAE